MNENVQNIQLLIVDFFKKNYLLFIFFFIIIFILSYLYLISKTDNLSSRVNMIFYQTENLEINFINTTIRSHTDNELKLNQKSLRSTQLSALRQPSFITSILETDFADNKSFSESVVTNFYIDNDLLFGHLTCNDADLCIELSDSIVKNLEKKMKSFISKMAIEFYLNEINSLSIELENEIEFVSILEEQTKLKSNQYINLENQLYTFIENYVTKNKESLVQLAPADLLMMVDYVRRNSLDYLVDKSYKITQIESRIKIIKTNLAKFQLQLENIRFVYANIGAVEKQRIFNLFLYLLCISLIGSLFLTILANNFSIKK